MAKAATLFLTIDGRAARVPDGSTVLDAVRAAGRDVPTLCHHQAVEPVGACRVCTVEVEQNGRRQLVTACNHPAAHGMKVFTDSEDVRTVRTTVYELLLARNPESDLIREQAFAHGVVETPYPLFDDHDLCIRCGLCVRICQQVGTEAIDFVSRGIDMEVGTPFMRLSPDCIGCGSCHAICPTGHITMVDEGHTRTIWQRKFQRIPCRSCGVPTVSPEQRDHLMKKSGLSAEYFEVCDQCKRKSQAEVFHRITQPVAQADEHEELQLRAQRQRMQLQQQWKAHP